MRFLLGISLIKTLTEQREPKVATRILLEVTKLPKAGHLHQSDAWHCKGSTCASHEALMRAEQTPGVTPNKWEDMSHFFLN